MTTRYGPRPDLGELTPGQKVMVYRSANDMRRCELGDHAVPAVVVKVARVWAELKRDDGKGSSQTWRMRQNTQDEGSQYSGGNARFATMEQYAWDDTRLWALRVLRENEIEIRPFSRWWNREVVLADAIVAALKEMGGEDKA